MKKPTLDIPSLTKSFNEALILAILAHEKKHGYQLALEIERKSDGLFKFNHGTLYPILHRLEKEKLIRGTWKQEGLKRQRKYYSLTAAGKKYLYTQVENWHEFTEHFFNIVGVVEK
jgi:DNA-binding PadR family transcriptional regulator